MYNEVITHEVNDFIYTNNGEFTHEGLAYRTLELLLLHREVKVKHPIQMIANFLYEESKYHSSEHVSDLMMETSLELIKYYSEDELDTLCLSVMKAMNGDIDSRYIEIADNH